MNQPRSNDKPNCAGCSGFQAMSRRSAIQAGIFGALGLSMGDFFRLQAGEEAQKPKGSKLKPKALSVIQIHLGGGMQQQESFDPKPEAPVEIRGGFGVLKTKTGEVFSENFPECAKISDKI